MSWEMSSVEYSNDGIKHLLKLNPSKLQKVTQYVLLVSLYLDGPFNMFARVLVEYWWTGRVRDRIS